MHYQKFKVQDAIKQKQDQEKSSDSYYQRFTKKYIAKLLDDESSYAVKKLAVEMLGAFVEDVVVEDALYEALEKTNSQPLTNIINSALDGNHLIEEETEYERYLRESGIAREVRNSISKEEEELRRLDRERLSETKNLMKFKAANISKS